MSTVLAKRAVPKRLEDRLAEAAIAWYQALTVDDRADASYRMTALAKALLDRRSEDERERRLIAHPCG